MKAEYYIWKYNEVGTLTDVDVVRTKEEVESYKIENEEGEMVFHSGVTDVAPPDDTPKYPGASPIYDETTQTWSEDKLAVQEHLESLNANKPKSETEVMREMIEALSYELTMIKLNRGE